jgi:hypothetical protein
VHQFVDVARGWGVEDCLAVRAFDSVLALPIDARREKRTLVPENEFVHLSNDTLVWIDPLLSESVDEG